MNNSFKETCIKLRTKDHTLNEIVRITKRPKTSVFFHIKNIPLSRERRREIKKSAGKRIVSFNKKRKGKSTLGRSPKPFTLWNEGLVSLISHLAFDGGINSRSCNYTNRNKVLIEKVEREMKSVYKFKPKKIETFPGIHRISYHNVELSDYMETKAQDLFGSVEKMSINLKRVFLRSFFDDEGCVSFNKKSRKRDVRGYQYNKRTLILIQNLLKNFDIESSISERHPEITISRRQNLEKFAKEINFSKGVKINGKRKNSIWKKDLEKREILKMTIESYKT